MDENPVEKIPLGRPRLMWEDVIRKIGEALNGELVWKARATSRGG